MLNSVVLAAQLHGQVIGWPKADQMVLDGGLVRPLRQMGFELILARLAESTSVLSVEWVEPVESGPIWANVFLSLSGESLKLRIVDGTPIVIDLA